MRRRESVVHPEIMRYRPQPRPRVPTIRQRCEDRWVRSGVTTWVLLLTAVACEVTGSLALKGALERPGLYAVVAIGYLASFGLLAAVLRRGMGLGVAYGTWGALGVASTALLSAWLYDEPLTALMVVGLALIVGGVLLVEGGAQAAAHRSVRVGEQPS